MKEVINKIIRIGEQTIILLKIVSSKIICVKLIVMKLDEQLFRNYNELHAMIKQCYRNVAILEVYKIINVI